MRTDIDLISVSDLAEATGRTEAAVRASLRRGHLPAVKLGRRWFVRRKDLDELFERAKQRVVTG